MRKSIPQKPRIILLANDEVGLAITRYLKQQKENIIALILHPQKTAKLSDKIKKIVSTENIFYADQIRDPVYLEKIKNLNPDLAILAWFGYILKKEFIDIFPSGCINFHNSFLPYNRGRCPQVWAINNGSKYGVTLHYIDEGIDTGDIIIRKKIKPEIIDTAGTLYEKALDEIVKLFQKNWLKIKANQIKPIKQNHKIATHHFAKDAKNLDFIDWNKKYLAKDLINRMRSGTSNDKAYTHFIYKGKKVYLKIFLSFEPHK